MKIKNVESKVYNCPLSWWKSSAGRYMNLGKLVIKYLAVPATSAPSERIWSRAARVPTVKRNRMKEDVTAAMMYCRENKHILHKHFTEIAKERMHEGDLLERGFNTLAVVVARRYSILPWRLPVIGGRLSGD